MAMGSSTIPMPLLSSRPQILRTNFFTNPSSTLLLGGERFRRNPSFRSTCAIVGGGSASDLAPVEISWQIAAGALAGVTPFIVAAVDFGKRIVAQRRCGECGGSGLVVRGESYSRCPTCDQSLMAMGASTIPMPLLSSRPQILRANFFTNSSSTLLLGGKRFKRNPSFRSTCAIVGGGSASDLAPVEISWQIAAGARAGVTPFIVAAFEFGKRIVAQRRCGECGGSGLVVRGESYSRCPTCGGFLPWRSWKRFFTG